jgi:hypothetical protein
MQWLCQQKRGGRGWTRLGAFTALAGLLAALAVTVAPSPANAGAIVSCPNGITEWRIAEATRTGQVRWEGYRYTLVSTTPRFAVSDGHVLDNSGTDIPVDYTISSERSQTYTVSVAVGVQSKPEETLKFLTTNVNVSVVSSVTTKLGVSFKLTVPARTRLTAEYGVEVYDVSYYVEAWRSSFRSRNLPPPSPGERCEEWGYYPQSTVAPTVYQTWRLRT